MSILKKVNYGNYTPKRQQPIYTVIFNNDKKGDNPIKLLTQKYCLDDIINTYYDTEEEDLVFFDGEYYNTHSYADAVVTERNSFFMDYSEYDDYTFNIYFEKSHYVEALDNFMLYMFENQLKLHKFYHSYILGSENSSEEYLGFQERLIRNYNLYVCSQSKDEKYMITLLEKDEEVPNNLRIYNNKKSLEFKYDNNEMHERERI